MPTLTLRDALPDEAPLVTHLILTVFEEFRGQLNPPSGAHNKTPDKVGAKMAQGGALLAVVEGEVAGCVLYYPEAGRMYLGRLAVLPAYRRHGVGQALVAAVEDKARQAGYNRVSLSVRVALPHNRAFFERMGYRWCSDEYHPGFTQPTFVKLEKKLG
jgi:GNAT superfamily N-acetyltransferase